MKIFTLGHGECTGDELTQLLIQHSVDVVVDIRSRSMMANQRYFQKAAVELMLKKKNIKYVYLGEQLGIENGKNGNEEGAAGDGEFAVGISRLESGVRKGYNICLLCSEENPAGCHRNEIILPALKERGIVTYHIRKNGRLDNEAVAFESYVNEGPVRKDFPSMIKDTLIGWRRRKSPMRLRLVD